MELRPILRPKPGCVTLPEIFLLKLSNGNWIEVNLRKRKSKITELGQEYTLSYETQFGTTHKECVYGWNRERLMVRSNVRGLSVGSGAKRFVGDARYLVKK